jgi:hypothetical protein
MSTTDDDKRKKPLSKGGLIVPCKSPKVREKILGGSLEGWILHEIPRSHSRLIDSYWYSPQTKKKFRSKVGVEKFIEILNEVGKDNEDIAIKRFQLYQKEKKGKKVNGSTARTSRKKTIPIESAKKTRSTARTGRKKKIPIESKEETLEEKQTVPSDVVAIVVGLTDEEWKDLLENDNVVINENQKKRKSITTNHPSTSFENSLKIQKCKEEAMYHMQEEKQGTLPHEERENILFAEAIISAVDEYESREAISKPDPFSAFHFSGDLVKPKKEGGHHELSTNTVPEMAKSKGCTSPSQREPLWL